MVAITSLLAFGAVAASTVYGSPFSDGKGCHGALKQLATEVPHIQHFCDSFHKSHEKGSSVQGFNHKKLLRTCECLGEHTVSNKLIISSSAKSNGGMSGSIAGQAAASVCKNVNLARTLSGIKDVTFFCQHFNPSQWSRGSPIFGSTTSAISQACSCILNGTASASSTSTTLSAATSATPSSSPFSSIPPFNFCPSSTTELSRFKGFCFTPLWKFWACSCSSVAQVCFPTTSLSWCPHSSHGSSSTTTIPAVASTTSSPPTTSITDPAAAASTSTDGGSNAASTTTVDSSSPTPDNSGVIVNGQFATGPALGFGRDIEGEVQDLEGDLGLEGIAFL